jgi:predicted Zn-dependent protease
MKQRVEDVHQLERQYAAQPNNVQIALQLIERYAQVQRVDAMDAIAQSLLARSDLSAADVMALAQPYAKLQRADRVTQILGVFVQRFPQNPVGWYNLGVIYAARNDCQQALTALESALAVDSPDGQVRKAAAQDRRLDNCRKDPRFQKLMEQPRVQGVEGTSGLPFTIAH